MPLPMEEMMLNDPLFKAAVLDSLSPKRLPKPPKPTFGGDPYWTFGKSREELQEGWKGIGDTFTKMGRGIESFAPLRALREAIEGPPTPPSTIIPPVAPTGMEWMRPEAAIPPTVTPPVTAPPVVAPPTPIPTPVTPVTPATAVAPQPTPPVPQPTLPAVTTKEATEAAKNTLTGMSLEVPPAGAENMPLFKPDLTVQGKKPEVNKYLMMGSILGHVSKALMAKDKDSVGYQLGSLATQMTGAQATLKSLQDMTGEENPIQKLSAKDVMFMTPEQVERMSGITLAERKVTAEEKRAATGAESGEAYTEYMKALTDVTRTKPTAREEYEMRGAHEMFKAGLNYKVLNVKSGSDTVTMEFRPKFDELGNMSISSREISRGPTAGAKKFAMSAGLHTTLKQNLESGYLSRALANAKKKGINETEILNRIAIDPDTIFHYLSPAEQEQYRSEYESSITQYEAIGYLPPPSSGRKGRIGRRDQVDDEYIEVTDEEVRKHVQTRPNR